MADENEFGETEDAKPYPIDFDALEKGSVISVEVLESYFGISRNDSDFAWKLLPFRDLVVLKLSQRGLDVVTRTEHGSIIIMDDDEASRYCQRQVDSDLNSMKRHTAQMSFVDENNLTEEQRKRHTRAALVASYMVQGAMEKRKEAVKLPEYKRADPGVLQLPEKKG